MNKKDYRSNFRKNVFERDSYTCQVCGKQWSELDADPSFGKLNAHHIIDRHEMPNGGYVLENGITVCDGDKDSCHMKCEKFHMTNGISWIEGLHPEDLFKKINSSFEMALLASERLK